MTHRLLVLLTWLCFPFAVALSPSIAEPSGSRRCAWRAWPWWCRSSRASSRRAWALLLPYFVILAVLTLLEWIVDSGTSGELQWGRVLVAGPLALALGFLVLFVAGQGLRGMLFSMKYKVPKPAPLA